MALRHQVVWAHVSVTDRRNADKPVDHLYERGQLLPDWVDEFTLFVLTSGGGVKAVDAPDSALLPDAAQPQVVTKQEHSPTLTDPASTLPASVRVEDHAGQGQKPKEAGEVVSEAQAPTATKAAPAKQQGTQATKAQGTQATKAQGTSAQQ